MNWLARVRYVSRSRSTRGAGMLLNGGFKRSFNWAPAHYPVTKRFWDDIKFSRPLGNSAGFAFVGNGFISSLVVRLFMLASPPAIIRAVVSVVINSIQRISVRARPHILIESFKRRKPGFADSNSTPTVSRESFIGVDGASTNHVYPRFEFFGPCGAVFSAG